jgi:DNA-nicking Smr family endonuclease
MPRRLHPEERALWGRVAASVKPMRGRTAGTLSNPNTAHPKPVEGLSFLPLPKKKTVQRFDGIRASGDGEAKRRVSQTSGPGQTLDTNWDKNLANGLTAPDRTIDLHGHSLASAHSLLNHALGDAVRHGARLVLLVTGKPARNNPRMPPTGRGVIRASVEDWIKAGPHASRIAAIRGAHPKHGGAGALYLVIRRDRAR